MLYEWVKEYAALGPHRTGSAGDRASANWLAQRLQRAGAVVTRQDFSFDRFSGDTTLLLDGGEIPSMPLYYQAIGKLTTDNIGTAEFSDGEHGAGLDAALEALIEQAMNAGHDALVIATRSATDDLLAINCEPKLRDRLPVVLVPGRYADALRSASLVLHYEARLKPGNSSNIIGRWGPSSSTAAFVITTPMSGWFSCASERGTGLAIALQLGEYLARKRPQLSLQLIAPSGHELGFCGAWHQVKKINEAPAAVLHLGSCIAAIDARLQCLVHADKPTRQAVERALAPLSICPRQPEDHRNPGHWVGESQCWAKFAMPMVSIAGMAPFFHTPLDLAETATTPELLEQAADCITGVALALIDAADCGAGG